VSLHTLNALLLAGIAGSPSMPGTRRRSRSGAIAVAIAWSCASASMSNWVLWEVAGLFENIGTVQDGINTHRPAAEVVDAPDARSSWCRGARSASRRALHYGARRPGVIDGLTLVHRPRREGRARRPLGGRQVDARQPAAALLRPGGGRILIDGQDIAG
jgi:ATP-binding cassette, subfamily B, multidrug efflux pump